MVKKNNKNFLDEKYTKIIIIHSQIQRKYTQKTNKKQKKKK